MSAQARIVKSDSMSPLAWVTSGALSFQVVAVGVGCALATLLPTGPEDRIWAILIPLAFLVVARPEARQRVLGWRARPAPRTRDRSVQPPERRAITAEVTVSPALPAASLAAEPQWIDTSSRETIFLRSFDRLEEILTAALVLQLGEIASAFSLQDTVNHLEETGFLTAIDLADWADCLAVRRSLLLTGVGRPAPSRQAVAAGLARMLHLQVTLTDRRRTLSDQEQAIGQQEEASLRRATGQPSHADPD